MLMPWSFAVSHTLCYLCHRRSAAWPLKELLVDLLTILGLTYLFRRLRRRDRDIQSTVTPNSIPVPLPRITVPFRLVARHHTTLFWRAARGLLLAGLLVLLALLPWPTAWATSAKLAPTILPCRLWIIANLDVVISGLVVFALIEPMLARILGPIRHSPRLLVLLAQLAWVCVRITYWRCRNWQCSLALAT
jgi:hypothetical protein